MPLPGDIAGTDSVIGVRSVSKMSPAFTMHRIAVRLRRLIAFVV
jgi:hypothetical protein